MPIPSKRQEILGIETNTPIADFLTSDNDVPINTDHGLFDNPNIEYPNPDNIKKAITDTLPVLEGVINTASDVVDSFMKILNESSDLGHLLDSWMKENMGETMGWLYKGIGGVFNPNPLSNIIRNPWKPTECEIGLNKLLELLNRLTNNSFSLRFNEDAALAALLAILYKLLCAGIPGAFGKIFSITTSQAVLLRAGVGYIIAGVRAKLPGTIIDVANTSIGNRVIHYVPDIASIAVASLPGFKPHIDGPPKQFYQDFVSALDTLDPEWRIKNSTPNVSKLENIGDKTIATIIENGLKHNTPTVNTSIYSNSFTADTDTNTIVGVRAIEKIDRCDVLSMELKKYIKKHIAA